MYVSLATALLGLAPAHSTPSLAEDYAPHEQMITLYLGGRAFDDDYEPVDEHGVFGFEFSEESVGSAVGYEFGLQISADEDDDSGVDQEAAVGEIYGGVRKTFGSGRLRPVLGGGFSIVTAAVEVGPFDDDDTSLAGYVHAGLGLAVGSNLTVGADARVLFGSDIELGGFETDADYGQFTLFLGIGL